MTRGIDKQRLLAYKKARKLGKTKTEAMINAGYAVKTAEHKTGMTQLVKVGEQQLVEEFKATDISVDWVVNELVKELSAPDAKASDRIRVKELLGKHINMFKDQLLQQVALFNVTTEDKAKRILEQAQNDVTHCPASTT